MALFSATERTKENIADIPKRSPMPVLTTHNVA
jgi:hypothetical protein